MEVFDSYFYLLENPDSRQIGLLGENICYKTKCFDADYYSRSRGGEFDSLDNAYKDWVDRGRALGLSYAAGKNTLLKIVLKAKDEPELIDSWVSHHSKIVGLENIVILDCGSKDPVYLEKLERLKSRILVLKYRRYYDTIHSVLENRGLYRCLAENCRYLTVLDADEFLVGRKGDFLEGSYVNEILMQASECVYFGGWLNNVSEVAIFGAGGGLAFSNSILFEYGKSSIISGLHAGKSLIRTDCVFDAKHVGHNMHVKDVVRLSSEKSFGDIFVLHLKNLGVDITRERIKKHLVAKGYVSADLSGAALVARVTVLQNNLDMPPVVRGYAHKFLDARGFDSEQGGEVYVNNSKPRAFYMPGLSDTLAGIDFCDLRAASL